MFILSFNMYQNYRKNEFKIMTEVMYSRLFVINMNYNDIVIGSVKSIKFCEDVSLVKYKDKRNKLL